MTAEPDDLIDRAGLRTVEEHASWREVCYALDVDPDPHTDRGQGRDEPVVLEEVGE